jgi:hypothetical protein
MRVLDELEREIVRVAGEAPRRRFGARLAVIPLSLAAVAVAASMFVLFGGSSEKLPPAKVAKVNDGPFGGPAGPPKLLGIRAQDPAGGAPWGLRLTWTKRGIGCVEAGRVVDGKLGAVGPDGSFTERTASVFPQASCQVPDAKGHLFATMTLLGTPSTGDPASCNPRRCPRDSLRTVYYGLLGPEATAVTYRDGTRIVRQEVSRPEGAYLVVKPTPASRKNVGGFSPGVSPASGLRSVEYADGSRCVIPDPRRLGGGRSCPLKGYVKPKLPKVTARDLASPVRLEVGTRPETPPGVTGRAKLAAQRRITIRFRARVAADLRSFYTLFAQMKNGGEGCSFGLGGAATTTDVRPGTIVRRDLWYPYKCRGRLEVKVGFTQQVMPSRVPLMPEGPEIGEVGRAEAQVR